MALAETRLKEGLEFYGEFTDVDFSSQCFFTDMEMVEIIRLALLALKK